MSGENFYNRQAQESSGRPIVPAATLEPTMPMISGANGAGDNKLPEFATFEKKDDQTSDERVPLTARSPSDRSPNTLANDMASTPSDMPYNGPIGPNQPRRSMSNSTLERDQYGNPIQVQDGYGVRRGPSFERMNSRGRGGMPPGGYRGRGGYPGPAEGVVHLTDGADTVHHQAGEATARRRAGEATVPRQGVRSRHARRPHAAAAILPGWSFSL